MSTHAIQQPLYPQELNRMFHATAIVRHRSRVYAHCAEAHLKFPWSRVQGIGLSDAKHGTKPALQASNE